MVTLHTNYGDITLALDAEKAPKTVENFLAYASEGAYDGTIFHRVINNFMIQGGGFDADMNQKSLHAFCNSRVVKVFSGEANEPNLCQGWAPIPQICQNT